MEKHRTGGMTAIAVFNIVFGGLGVLIGLLRLLGFFVLIYEMLREGVFEFPAGRLAYVLLLIATGTLGLVAGIGILRLRPWARALSLAYAGLLIVSCVASFFALRILATFSILEVGSLHASDLVRITIFIAIDFVIPTLYSIVLLIILHKPAWKTTFR